MTFEEFNRKYYNASADWDFNKFTILCNKCDSDKVEFNGKMETQYGLYGSFDVISMIVVKCSNCGNAFAMKNLEGGSSGYCVHDD